MEVSETLAVDCVGGISYFLILNHYLHGLFVICDCQATAIWDFYGKVAISIVCLRLCPHLLRQVLQPSLRSPFFPRVPRVVRVWSEYPPSCIDSGQWWGLLLGPWSHRAPRTCCCCPLKPHCPRAPWTDAAVRLCSHVEASQWPTWTSLPSEFQDALDLTSKLFFVAWI